MSLSLREQLKAAWDGEDESGKEESKNDSSPKLDNETTERKSKPDGGNESDREFNKNEGSGNSEASIKSKQASDEKTSTDSDPNAASSLEQKLTPPEHWSSADKAVFNEVPRKQQQWLLDRHKEMEAGFTRKTQEHAENYREYKSIDQAIAPLKSIIQSQGMTVPQAVAMWAQYQQALLQNPQQVIQHLAQMYGVKLGEGEQQVDPLVQQLRGELHTIKSTLTQQQQWEQQEREAAISRNIETFANEKDEAGNPKHPYFNDVIGDIIVLAQAKQQMGIQPDLKDLYDQAVWASPTVREKILASQREAEAQRKAKEQEEKQKEEQLRVQKAKEASAMVSGSPNGSAGASMQGSTLRQLLQEQLRAQEGRI